MEKTREVTAKLRVQWVQESEWGTQLVLGAAYDDFRNKEWAAATPYAELRMTVRNPLAAEVFTHGRNFLVTFTPED